MKRIALCGMFTLALLSGCGPSISELRQNGVAEFQVGNADKAKDYFQQVLGRQPYDAATLYYMGRITHSEGAYEKAIWYYQCSIDADPRNEAPKRYLARAEEEAGQVGPALRFIPEQPQVAVPKR